MTIVSMTDTSKVRLTRDRMTGLRFAQLIRQLEESGWTYSRIAEAIGCSVSLISKTANQHAALSAGVAQKGLRDDVLQGIYDGLGVRLDYFVMRTPKGYSTQIRLEGGQTRPAEKHELDIKDFQIVTNEQLEAARDKKERAALRNDVDANRAEFREFAAEQREQNARLERLLASLGAEDRAKSVR